MVVRSDPFRDVDRFAEQLFSAARGPRVMPMDLHRSGEHVVLHADLPGVDPGSIDVHVDNGVLTVRAERSGRTEEGVGWLAHERPAGTFLRRLTLGDAIDGSRTDATYENGVLTLTMPIAERAKPRRILVAVGAPRPVEVSGASGSHAADAADVPEGPQAGAAGPSGREVAAG